MREMGATAVPAAAATTAALPPPADGLPHHVGARDTYPTPPSSDAGPVGTAMLYEDEETRIWENRLSAHWVSWRPHLPRYLHIWLILFGVGA